MMTSEEVAQVLRKAANPVRMVIARVITDDSGDLPPRKPVVCVPNSAKTTAIVRATGLGTT